MMLLDLETTLLETLSQLREYANALFDAESEMAVDVDAMTTRIENVIGFHRTVITGSNKFDPMWPRDHWLRIKQETITRLRKLKLPAHVIQQAVDCYQAEFDDDPAGTSDGERIRATNKRLQSEIERLAESIETLIDDDETRRLLRTTKVLCSKCRRLVKNWIDCGDLFPRPVGTQCADAANRELYAVVKPYVDHDEIKLNEYRWIMCPEIMAEQER